MAHDGFGDLGRARAVVRRTFALAATAWMISASPSLGQFGGLDGRSPTARPNAKVYFDASHKADADLRAATITPGPAISPRRSTSISG